MTGKIEKYSLSDKAIELKANGFTYPQIAEELSKLAVATIDHQAVLRFFKKFNNKKALIEQKDYQMTKKVEKMYDVYDKLNSICTKLDNALEQVTNPRDPSFHKIIQNIHENIKIVAKITGQIEAKKEQNITINMVDLAPKIHTYISKMKNSDKLICRDCGSKNIEVKE
jgi:hypothetical protein